MKTRSFIVYIATALLLVGGGCDRISERMDVKKTAAPAPVVVVPLITKETIDLSEVELFLRSRDDVAPGQPDVTNQTLYAKTKSGEIVEIVKDVHEALGGRLHASAFLVLQKDIQITSDFIYFIEEREYKTDSFVSELHAFDKKTKLFVQLPATQLTESQNVKSFMYSPDRTMIAVLRIEPEEANVVYIVDLKTGNVSQTYETSLNMSFVQPPNEKDGTLLDVHAETKWSDAHKFQIALFKDKQKPVGGKHEPSKVVVIDTQADVESIKKENKLLDGAWKTDIVNKAFFVQHPDGFWITVSYYEEIGNVFGTEAVINESMGDRGHMFVTQSSKFGTLLAAVFDKTNGKWLSIKGISPALYAIFEDPLGENAVYKHAKKSVYGVVLKSVTEERIDLFDINTLKIISSTQVPIGFSTVNYYGKCLSDGFETYSGAKNKWVSDKKLQIELYPVVARSGEPGTDGCYGGPTKKRASTKTIEIQLP